MQTPPGSSERSAHAANVVRDDDALAGLEASDALSERDDLGHKLVTDCKGALEGGASSDDRTIQVAAPDRDRPHDRLLRPLQSRLGDLAPLERARPDEGQLSHAPSSPGGPFVIR